MRTSKRKKWKGMIKRVKRTYMEGKNKSEDKCEGKIKILRIQQKLYG